MCVCVCVCARCVCVHVCGQAGSYLQVLYAYITYEGCNGFYMGSFTFGTIGRKKAISDANLYNNWTFQFDVMVPKNLKDSY